MMHAPQCHPERPYFARGMCRSCYDQDYAIRNPAMIARANCKEMLGAARDNNQEYYYSGVKIMPLILQTLQERLG